MGMIKSHGRFLFAMFYIYMASQLFTNSLDSKDQVVAVWNKHNQIVSENVPQLIPYLINTEKLGENFELIRVCSA